MAPVSLADLLAQIDVDDAQSAAIVARSLLADPRAHLLAHTGPMPVAHWARVYRMRQSSIERAGTTADGFLEVFARFESLAPDELLSLVAVEMVRTMGLFWLNERNSLASFVILDRRD